MDPLTRGSLFHKVQAEFFRALRAAGRAAGHAADASPTRSQTLDAVLDRVAAEYAETLAPAIERVWRDEIDELRRDLGIWVQQAGRRAATGCPTYFEFSFGLNDEGRDPRSLPDPVIVDGRFMLRGSVDLIEQRARPRRAARHRSQDRQEPIEPRPDRRRRRGAAAGALQRGGRAGARQEGGRRAGCSTARPPAASPSTRSRSTTTRAAQGLAGARRSSIARSSRDFSPPRRPSAPARWCDFRPVCGPREEERVKRKAERSPGRPRGAEVDAMTVITVSGRRPTPRRAARSPTISTTRWSSRRRPAPARRPSWSTGSCACSPPAARR